MWEIVAVTMLGGGVLWLGIQRTRKRLKRWQDAATACGLRVTQAPTTWSTKLEARKGPLWVRIATSGSKGQSTRIVVAGSGPPDLVAVRIRPESLLQLAPESEIGDQAFDDAFFIEGPVRMAAALLDAEIRRLLLDLNRENRVEIHLGGIRAEGSDEKVLSLLPRLLDIGQRLAQPMNVSQRLAENACKDPRPGVRLQNLLLLIREQPRDAGIVEAFRAACSDPSPQIRLHAAQELGTEGHGVLLEIAESLVSDDLSAGAVSALGRGLPFERAQPLLNRAMKLSRLETARACLDVIGRSGDAAAVGVLAKMLTGELAADAAQALGETGSPEAERPLLRVLQGDQNDLRRVTANALARVGSARAVLPLKELAEHSRLDLDLRRAARQAVAEIQSRIHGSPGQLSLTGAEAGRLSLAQAEAGQLSIATEPAGQLSLSDADDALKD